MIKYPHTYFNHRYQKWMSRIRVNGKRILVGYFTTSRDAAIAYNEAQVKHFGADARLIHIYSPSTVAA